MGTVYRMLLRVYPCDFRVWFGAEMTAAFHARAREHSSRGRAALLRFALAEIVSVLKGAWSERWAKLTTDPAVRALSVPDLRMLRPAGVPSEVYFSRAAVEKWRRHMARN